MKTADFRSEIARNGQIVVPPEIASQVPPGEIADVVLTWDVSEEERAWREAGKRAFECAYAPEDAVYEQLVNNASGRVKSSSFELPFTRRSEERSGQRQPGQLGDRAVLANALLRVFPIGAASA